MVKALALPQILHTGAGNEACVFGEAGDGALTQYVGLHMCCFIISGDFKSLEQPSDKANTTFPSSSWRRWKLITTPLQQCMLQARKKNSSRHRKTDGGHQSGNTQAIIVLGKRMDVYTEARPGFKPQRGNDNNGGKRCTGSGAEKSVGLDRDGEFGCNFRSRVSPFSSYRLIRSNLQHL